MKIRTKSATTVAVMAGALLVASCATDVETGINTDPEGNAINFAASVGRVTRATPINIENLGDFAVVARGMHPDGVLYNAYIIGSAENGGEIAKFSSLGENNSGIWKLDRNVYWSASMSRALFIGYTTLKRDKESESSTSGVLGDAKFAVPSATDKPTISDFSPLKADIAEAKDDNGIWADGSGQKDLLVAFKAQDRGTSTTVNLNFRHALTQVSIKAERKGMEDTDERIVKVKGAWLVNAAKTGVLSADIKVGAAPDYPVTNKTSWTATGLETYGSYYNDGIPLTKGGEFDLLRESLMIIPQNLTAWNGNSETTTGAYIMLLCRVEQVHSGTSHDGSTNIEDIAIDGDKHYHQLFPVNTEKYDGAEYGFVCVPLSTDWNDEVEGSDDSKGMGKHYTYKLDICGSTSGAGVYPPIPAEGEDALALIEKLIPSGAKESALVLQDDGTYKQDNVDLIVVTKRAAGKKVGDPVLDEPIKFSVTVNDWKNPEDWTSGDVSF